MITLQRPDSKVSAFLGEEKGVGVGDAIRPSQFALPLHLGARRVVFNTLTKQCIETSYFDWFEHPEERVFADGDAEMAALLRQDFLVAPGLDEAKRYAGLIATLRAIEQSEPGYTGYTIMPTTACNARCPYCFERGMRFETMSEAVVEQTIRYILRTRRDGSSVDLHWFGGEPLLGEACIDTICAALRAAGVPYRSAVTTNGSLVTAELAEKAKEDWHVETVQITLDGREEMYCARKRYVSFSGSPYRAVLDGIHALLGQGIRVSIRLNVDEGNLDEMMALADELEAEFAHDGRLSMYCHSIFANDEDAAQDNDAFYQKMATLNERLHAFNANRRKQRGENASYGPVCSVDARGLAGAGDCPEDGASQNLAATSDGADYYDRRGYTRRYFCQMDNPASGGVILPSGDICLCEHVRDMPKAGSVQGDEPLARSSLVVRGRQKDKKCATCALLPMCTDLTGCPARSRDCYQEELAIVVRDLRDFEREDRLPPLTVSVDGRIIRVVEPTVEFAEQSMGVLAGDYLRPDETISCERAWQVVFGKSADEESSAQRERRLRAWAAREKELAASGSMLDPPRYCVLEERKLAYLVNSKVACSSIKASMIGPEIGRELRDNYSVHAYAENLGFMRDCLEDADDYFVFTFVRNPFARLVSCYEGKYHTDVRSGKKRQGEFEDYLDGYLREDGGFAAFVERVCEIPWRLMDKHFMLQYHLVYADDGTCRCDFVGKLETIAEGYEAIRQRYDVRPLPHFNASYAPDWRGYYTPELARMVHEKYQLDFECFGYEESYQDLLRYLEAGQDV